MKRKCLIGVRVVVFFLICLCIMHYLSCVFTITHNEEYPVRSGLWQNINAEENNTIDVLFIGDSAVTHAINPVQIWRDTKITSYDVSYALMKPQEAYFDLKKMFSFQAPKILFIEVQFMVEMKTDKFDYFTDDANGLVDFADDEIAGEIGYYLPVMKYKKSWEKRSLSDLKVPHPSEINNIFKGYYYASETKPYEKKISDSISDIATYKNSGYIYFDKIYKLCKNNNCQLVLINLPQRDYWNQKKHDLIATLAEQYDVVYLDYDTNVSSFIPDFSWDTDTKDGGMHLNYSGATKVTNSIEKNLTQMFNILPSNLTASQANKWNEDMSSFYEIAE